MNCVLSTLGFQPGAMCVGGNERLEPQYRLQTVATSVVTVIITRL